MIQECYREISISNLTTQVKTVWLDDAGDLKKDKDTFCRNMLFQVISNLLTKKDMNTMMHCKIDFLIKEYHDPVYSSSWSWKKVNSSCCLNVKALKKDLCNLNLKTFKYIVPDANLYADEKIQEINKQGQEY